MAAPVIFHVGLCMSGLEVTLRPLLGRCLAASYRLTDPESPTDRPNRAPDGCLGGTDRPTGF